MIHLQLYAGKVSSRCSFDSYPHVPAVTVPDRRLSTMIAKVLDVHTKGFRNLVLHANNSIVPFAYLEAK